MKTIRFTISALCLSLVSLTYGQEAALCTDFNSGNLDGWQTYNTISSITTPGRDQTNFLKLVDLLGPGGYGNTWGYNSTSYPHNWDAQFINYCLCFDFRVLHDNHVVYTPNVPLNIIIYDGADPQTSNLRATFVSNISATDYDGWKHACAPIKLSDGVTLPSNAHGQWTGVNPLLWNTLLSHVGGIAFSTYIGDLDPYSLYPIDLGVDNICIVECPFYTPPSNAGAYCCEEDNLVTNGNFEFGNTGFSSTYANNVAVNLGQYDITNAATALSTFQANITDHSFCANSFLYSSNNLFMVVNGRTQKNNTAVIWEQTISGLDKNSTYKFCANLKNMPQCTFDINPNVKMQVVGKGDTGFMSISESATDPCAWAPKDLVFKTGQTTSVTLRIILDQKGNGDGNDLAIDDISVTKLSDPELSITVQNQGNPAQITASINTISPGDDWLHGSDCEYNWWVYEVTSLSAPVPPHTLPSSFVSGNLATHGWDLTTTFHGYPFVQDKLYMIGMYTPACGCYDEGFTYQFTLNHRGVSDEFMSEELKQLIINQILNGNNGTLSGSDQVTYISDDLVIYPNPAADSFTVSLKGNTLKSVEVLSLSGQTLLIKNYSAGKAEEILDISTLASGIYLVKVYGLDNKQFITKVIKE